MNLFHFILSVLGRYLTRNKLSILIYHQVLVEDDPMRPTEPTREFFSWQMKLISKYFTPLSLTQALECLNNNTLPDNAICVTFDDGYINNLTVAVPILQKLNIPSTVYIATSFIDGNNMFNDRIIDLIGDKSISNFNLSAVSLGKIGLTSESERIATYKKMISKVKYLPIEERDELINRLYQDNNKQEYPRRMMDKKQLLALSSAGVDVGAHTVVHPILKAITVNEQKEQILKSKVILEKILSKPVINFAYPNGKFIKDYTLETVQLVADAGFESAVTTNTGYSNKFTEKFQLYRFTPWDKSPLRFHLRLLQNVFR